MKIWSRRIKNAILISLTFFFYGSITAQVSCSEMLDYVKSEDYGTSYYSYSSDAINEVSFHEITDDSYNTYYFAVVRFTISYSEYLYQVDSDTEFNYSLDYHESAGQAFYKHIYPYRDVLGCAPD